MTIRKIVHALWPVLPEPAPSRVFALVDAAADGAIHPALLGADCPWLCLYRGNAAITMAEVAPYLVHLTPSARFTRWLLERGWGRSWGVFAVAAVPIDQLQAHFRRLVMARLPDGRSVFFRFYDPRVLRVYLPTCTEEELRIVFGPVERYVMETGAGGVATFDRENDPLQLAGTV